MDEEHVREQIALIREELAALEMKHHALVKALDGFESWMRAHKLPIDLDSTPPTPIARRGSAAPDGEISVRQAVAQVLRSERGRALEAHSIWHRAQALGAVTSAKDPSRVIDALCYGLAKAGYPLRKVGPMTWQWIEEQSTPIEDREESPVPLGVT